MKKFTGIFLIVVVSVAVATGVGIYNTPTNRINRHLDLGQKYLEEQNYELAIVEFNKAIEIDPMNVDAYLGLSQAYQNMGEIDTSVQALEKLYEKTNNEQIKDSLILMYAEQEQMHLDLGQKYLEKQNYELSIAEFDKVLEINPMNVEAYIGKAQAYKSIGDLDKMLEALQDGYELTKDERMKSQFASCIPSFDIGDIKVLGYDLLGPHFNEVINAAGYSSYLEYAMQRGWNRNKLQNLKGEVEISVGLNDDGTIYNCLDLAYPIGERAWALAFEYHEFYNDTKWLKSMLWIRKLNGKITDTLQLGESWCDLPIFVEDSYEEWCAQIGVDLIKKSSFVDKTVNNEINKNSGVNATCNAYSMSYKAGYISYSETIYETPVQIDDDFDYDKLADLLVHMENGKKLTMNAFFLDGVVQEVRYDIYESY